MKKIILSGGGTGGSIMPLLALAKTINSKKTEWNCEFLWLGTKNGPERELVEKEGIRFKALAGGKWRRYFSLANFFDLAKIKLGFWQSLFILKKFKPDLIISAGSFISVPVVWAGWVFKIPSLIHQQDLRPGLANKLMAPFAKAVTVTFGKSLSDYGRKAVWTGNLIRDDLTAAGLNKAEALKKFGFKNDLPVVLAIGGSTGAAFINNLIADSAKDLTNFCQVILAVGKGRADGLHFPEANFKFFEFLDNDNLIKALSAADIVISRCGMSFLSELSYFSKPAILIPMPDSHQEANAAAFAEKNAAVILNQAGLNKDNFVKAVKNSLSDKNKLEIMGRNTKKVVKIDENNAMLDLIGELTGK